MTDKQVWPAPERNKGPIVQELARVLPERGSLLEIASGTGQHAAFFAERLPGWSIQPSDYDDENLSSIRVYVSEAARDNLAMPVRLDVTLEEWGVGTFDAIFNANMIHIARWSVCEGLCRGLPRVLSSGGLFVLYGPFQLDGEHTSQSNADFDSSLKERDPSWGVRDLSDVRAQAERNGMVLVERVQMPANNQLVVFRRA